MTADKSKKSGSRHNGSGKVKELSDKIVSLSADLKASTLYAIISAADVVIEFSRIRLRQSDMGRTQFRILNVLVTHAGHLTLTEISRKVLRSKYSTTRVINNLIEEGLVTKKAIKTDHRAKNIAITKKGVKLIETTLPNRGETAEAVTSCLTEEEMMVLSRSLGKVRKHLLGLIGTKNKSDTIKRGKEHVKSI